MHSQPLQEATPQTPIEISAALELAAPPLRLEILTVGEKLEMAREYLRREKARDAYNLLSQVCCEREFRCSVPPMLQIDVHSTLAQSALLCEEYRAAEGACLRTLMQLGSYESAGFGAIGETSIRALQVEILLKLGGSYLGQKRQPAAAHTFDRAIDAAAALVQQHTESTPPRGNALLAPRFLLGRAHYHRALIFLNADETELAEKHFQAVLQNYEHAPYYLVRESADAHLNLGRICLLHNRPIEARAHFRCVCALEIPQDRSHFTRRLNACMWLATCETYCGDFLSATRFGSEALSMLRTYERATSQPLPDNEVRMRITCAASRYAAGDRPGALLEARLAYTISPYPAQETAMLACSMIEDFASWHEDCGRVAAALSLMACGGEIARMLPSDLDTSPDKDPP